MLSPVTYTGIKGIQRGTIVSTGAVTTATITAVNTAKSQLFLLGIKSAGAVNASDAAGNIVLTNSTTISFNTNGAATNQTASYELIEWN